MASLAGKPKPSKKEGTTAARTEEYSRTSSSRVSIWRFRITRSPSPKRRL